MTGKSAAQDCADPIVVTGIGLVTALGFGVTDNWTRLIRGDSGIEVLDASSFAPIALPIVLPVRLGASVPREELAERIRAAVPRSVWNTSADVCHVWLLAALEALTQAGLWQAQETKSVASDDGRRVGIFVGTGGGAAGFTEQEYTNVFTAEKAILRDVSRMAIPKYMASSLAGQLSQLIGSHGPAMAVNTACSSGATAIGLALDMIRAGRIDRAIAGGADLALTAGVLKGFSKLGALSTNHGRGSLASRPFSADRDGFVLGEGAAGLVLERASGARARGARPLATLAGEGQVSEAYNLLSPKEDGVFMAECMDAALTDASLPAAHVRHVYTHGTSTPTNDRYEALALRSVFADPPTISATKAQIGHTLGAAGAIDAALSVQGFVTGQVVPCQYLEAVDPECPVQPARNAELLPAQNGRTVMLVNSFGFGGHNVTLVVTPPAQ